MNKKRKPQLVFSILVSSAMLFSCVPSPYSANAAGGSTKPSKAKLNPSFQYYLKNNSVVSSSGGYVPAPINITKENISLKQAENLPAKYDLRILDRLTPVKDQGSIGSCWSFASYSALESNMLSLGLGRYDFSENNLITQHGFDVGPDDGGNLTISTAYMARWSGPVLEEKDPYPSIPVPGNIVYRNGLSADKHLQEVLYLPERLSPTDNVDIKNAVMKYGAVDTAINYNDNFLRYSNNAFYDYLPYNQYDSYTWANHEVTIVGWDDNYSASNFRVTPPGNGAFIARNNWGSTWGDNGYFYISYYDKIAGTENAVYTSIQSTKNYNNIYQYDTLGMITTLGYDDPQAWFANVFTENSSSPNPQVMSAASFYTTKKNTSYEIYVETDFQANGFNNLKLVKSGFIDMPGYHTIKLDKPSQLGKGKKFAVAVKIYTPGESNPVGIEFAAEGFSSKATAGYGESFMSYDGLLWDDIKLEAEINPYLQLKNTNVCLKAFTQDADSKDLTGDNIVDIMDLAQVAKNYNSNNIDVQWDNKLDMNGDNVINLFDLVFISMRIMQ